MQKLPNILIVSMARSGSSALFELIKNSCDVVSLAYFEPTLETIKMQVLPRCKEDSRTIVKAILRPYLQYEKDLKGVFSKIIGLTRDPRDNLISRLLFRLISEKFRQNPHIYEKILPMLEQKISFPESVSVVQIFRIMESSGLMENMIDNRVEENLALFMDWHDRNPASFIFSYENFILRNFDELCEYLNLSLCIDKNLKVVRPEIKREGKFGGWKNWFTNEDINFFRPRMEKFLKRYEYTDDWNLSDHKVIKPENTINYVKKYAGIA